MVKLISASSTLGTESRCSPIRILQDYLKSRDIETRVFDFWFDQNTLNPLNLRRFGPVQEMPNYDLIMEALNGNLNGDGTKFISRVLYVANRIPANDDDIFGFSTTILTHYAFILFALVIKKKNPKTKIVFGGYHISLGDKYAKFLLEKGIADFVVKNDGCEPLYNIYHGIEKEKYIIGNFIPNFWPNFDRIDATLSNNVLSTITSYGCSNNCYFCASDRQFQDINMQQFEQYLQLMITKGFKKVELNDDNPNITSKRFSEIAEIMKRCKVEGWMCFVNPVIIPDIPKDSNLKAVTLGAESFSDNILKIVNKKQTKEQILKSIDFYINKGVTVYCTRIVGFPGETEEEFNNDFKILESLKRKYKDKIVFWASALRIFPGSYMYYNPEKFGITYSFWKDTDIPKDYFIEGIDADTVEERIKKIRTAFPPEDVACYNKDQNILIRRS